jgi:hypothetical protein
MFADPPCRRILRFREAPRHPDGSRIEREIAFADRAQGHVRSLLHEVAFVARFTFDEKQALSNASSAALLSCTVRLRSLTEEDWARLFGPLRQRRELARCEISGAC